MRIEDSRRREIDSSRKKNAAFSVSTASNVGMFGSLLELEERRVNNSQFELDELREEIYRVGQKLEEEPNIETYNDFRDLIKTLLQKVSKEAYEIKVVGSFRKKYNVVSTVNEELDSLYREIIKEQKNHLAITNKIVRLKGLVIDILS